MYGEEGSVVSGILKRVDEGDQRLDGIGTHRRGCTHHNQRLKQTQTMTLKEYQEKFYNNITSFVMTSSQIISKLPSRG